MTNQSLPFYILLFYSLWFNFSVACILQLFDLELFLYFSITASLSLISVEIYYPRIMDLKSLNQ